MNNLDADKILKYIKNFIDSGLKANEMPEGLNDNVIMELNKLAEQLSENYYSREEVDNSINKLEDTVLALAALNFTKKTAEFSTDIFESLRTGLSMLGEELQHSTVSKNYLDNIYRSISDMLIVTDEKCLIRTVNEATLKLLKYDEKELIGKPIDILFYDETNQCDENKRIDFSNKKNIVNKEKVFLTKEDEKITVLFSVNAMYNKNSSIEGVVWLAQDIEHIKKAQKKLLRAKTEAEKANRLKSEFLANVSHEIRTPMNVILGYTEILQKDLNEDSRYNKYLEKIKKESRNLLDLFNDIIDLSKIESGDVNIQNEPLRPVSVIKEIVYLFEQKFANKSLSIKFNIDEKMPTKIISDSVRFNQIFVNLISNAFKFTKKGSITINLKLSNVLKGQSISKSNLDIEIIDTGIGISKKHQKYIFNPFRQVDGKDTREFGGIGMGLAIAKRLVEMMNGTLSVKSELGKGSVFTVHFNDIEIPILNIINSK